MTQLYFEGDAEITTDPWASENDAIDRIIPLIEDTDGNKAGTFDIKLTPS